LIKQMFLPERIREASDEVLQELSRPSATAKAGTPVSATNSIVITTHRRNTARGGQPPPACRDRDRSVRRSTGEAAVAATKWAWERD
jgi:hypothetical protein